jgi:phospholipid/cholesterol/gamma-HCH transport system substrate-binding protein
MTSNNISWSNLKVGIVVLLGLVLFIFFISVVGTDANLFTPTYYLKLYMPNVQGLVNGGMVSLGGLKIGFVKDMKFVTRNSMNGVDILMEIQHKYSSSITTSTVAQIKTIGLLGDKYVDLSIGTQGETPLEEYAYVPLIASFDLEAAGPKFKAALDDFTALMGSMKNIAAHIEKGEGSVGKIIAKPDMADEMEHLLKSLNGTMGAIERKEGTLGALIYDPALSRNISQLSQNLKAVTGQIKEGKGTAGKLIMDETLYNNLTSFTSRADSILAKANADSSNVSKLVSDPNFYKSLSDVIHDLNALLVDIKSHPERYIHFSVF